MTAEEHFEVSSVRGTAKTSPTTLRTRLLILVIVTLLPAFGFIFYSLFEQRREAAENVHESARHRIQAFAAGQQGLIENAHKQLLSLAHMPIVRSADAADMCNQTFSLLLQTLPRYTNLGVANLNGDVRCSAVPLAAPVNVADRQYFREAIQTQGFVVGEFLTGRITGKPAVTVAHPVLGEYGDVNGVVFISINPTAAIQESIARIPLPEGSALIVIDDQGVLMTRDPDPELWMGKSLRDTPLIREILLRQGSGSVEAPGVDGIARLNVFEPFFLGANRRAYISTGAPLALIYANANHQFQRNLLLMIAMAIVALAIAWISGTVLILNPARALIAAAKTLGQGNLQARTQLQHTSDEFGQLAMSFDEMAASLEQRDKKLRNAEIEIRTLNADLEQRVLDRTAQLNAANKELEAFSYSVSHDLRTPLRSIEGFSQVLLDDNLNKLDAESLGYLQRIRVATQRMGQLIDDLLNLAHITRTPMQYETVNISALAADIATELRELEPTRSVHISIQSDLIAQGDPRLLRALLENLLSNAWKFTGKTEAAHIELGRAVRTKTEQTFFISDNGAGFDMTYVGNLFSAFQRLHNSSEFSGTGIGLATAQRIVSRHGGRIYGEGAVGKGAAFYFVLPLNRNNIPTPLSQGV